MSSAITAAFVAVSTPLEGAAAALAAFASPAMRLRRLDAKGPAPSRGTSNERLYNLTPELLDERAKIEDA